MELYTDREPRPAIIFLAPGCAPEHVFEGDEPFFPAEEAGAIRLYARSSVVSLVMAAREAPPDDLAVLRGSQPARSIAVHLRNGNVLTGALRSPGVAVRTLDFVNDRAKSFAVHTRDHVYHVAKAHVERIEET